VKQENPNRSEVMQYTHTLNLYFEYFCGWRCRLYGDLFYYDL